MPSSSPFPVADDPAAVGTAVGGRAVADDPAAVGTAYLDAVLRTADSSVENAPIGMAMLREVRAALDASCEQG